MDLILVKTEKQNGDITESALVIFHAVGAPRLARPNTISCSGSKGKIMALEFQRRAMDKQHHLPTMLPRL